MEYLFLYLHIALNKNIYLVYISKVSLIFKKILRKSCTVPDVAYGTVVDVFSRISFSDTLFHFQGKYGCVMAVTVQDH